MDERVPGIPLMNGHHVSEQIQPPASSPKNNGILSFMNPNYRPFPEYDIEVEDLRFCYRPEYNDYFIAQAKEKGLSLVAISDTLRIPFRIIQYWAFHIKKFAVALDLAEQAAQSFHEKELYKKAGTKGENFGPYLKMMSIRFPATWRDPEAEVAQNPYGSKVEKPTVQGGEPKKIVFIGVASKMEKAA